MGRHAVLYLLRKGTPPRHVRAFLASLAHHPSGAEYELVVVFKGYAAAETDQEFERYRGTLPCPVHEMRIRDELFPIAVFFEIARALAGFERILFLVSYSRILAPNWFSSFLGGFDSTPNCGVVGATGGFESIPGAPFPNINLRTNGFIIARDLFLDLDHGSLDAKRGGNFFEAGQNSMTRQILNRGLVPVIVDRFGKSWSVEDWPQSRTFRSGHQERLLVADNRTYHYDVAGPAKRRRLAIQNWGEKAYAPPASLALRMAAAWRWYFPHAPRTFRKARQE